MPEISKFLRRADRQVWSRFLNSEEGQRGLAYLKLSCPRSKEDTEASLIRNAVGFDFWHKSIDAMESLGEVPEKPVIQEEDALER